MAFNNDVSVTKMFSRIYLLLTGEESNGFTLIELTYCIGLIVGILIFLQSFRKKEIYSRSDADGSGNAFV